MFNFGMMMPQFSKMVPSFDKMMPDFGSGYGTQGAGVANTAMGNTGSKMGKKSQEEEEVAPVVDISNLEAIQKLRRPYSGQNYMNLGGGQF